MVGRVVHHRRRNAGERDDLRRDAPARIDERGEFAQHRAAAHLDSADLGDRVVALAGGAAAGGLQVHDDEGGLAQRDGIHVEGQLCPASGWAPGLRGECPHTISEAELAHALKVGNTSDSCVVATRTDRNLSVPVDNVRTTPIERTAKWAR